MSTLSKLAHSFLPEIFYNAIWGDDDYSNQPAYFLGEEHVNAIKDIVRIRSESIEKQGLSFEDLVSDLKIIDSYIWGDSSHVSPGQMKAFREAQIQIIKEGSEAQRREFLDGVYNVFKSSRIGPIDLSRFDERPAYEKWIGESQKKFAALMVQVRDDNSLLLDHSVKITRSHRMNDPHSVRSDLTRDVVDVIQRTILLPESIIKARGELDKGFGKLYGMMTGALKVSGYSGEEFDREFVRYADQLTATLNSIEGSRAQPDDHLKWNERIDAVEELVEVIRRKQDAIMYPQADVGRAHDR